MSEDADTSVVKDYKKLQNDLKDYSDGLGPVFGICFLCIGLLFASIYSLSVGLTWVSVENFETIRFNQVIFDYSSSWNAQLEIQPNDSRSNVFVLSSMPGLVQLPQQLNEQYSLDFGKNFTFLTFRLQQYSNVNLSYNANCNVGFYLIHGISAFERYANSYVDFGPLQGRIIFPDQYSRSRIGSISQKYDYGGEYDSYKSFYFIWESNDQNLCNVEVNVTLDVYVYDTVTNLLQTINGSGIVSLDYGQKKFVLVDPFDYLNKNFSGAQINVASTSRFTTWFGLGIGIAAPLLLLACLCTIKGLILTIQLRLEKMKLLRILDGQPKSQSLTILTKKTASHDQYVQVL